MKTKLHALSINGLNSLVGKYFFIFTLSLLNLCRVSAQVTVTSVAQLATVAAQSNQIVTMTPGVYEMTDYLSSSTVIASVTPEDEYGRRAMIRFSGSNNTFNLTGVAINVDTELLNDLGGNVAEFHLTGDNINFKGLTVTDIGASPTASGGQSFVVSGDEITVENVTLNMSGSSPYGYGDLLGKGGGSLVAMRKHSGLLVEGLNISILGCSIYSTSFGHLFFIQGGRNVLFQDCYAEAVTRTTNDMLAETSGTAFDLDFEAVYANYDGESVITPDYTKSLSEVGFRAYGSGYQGDTTSGLTFVNCVAKNTRVGFALEVGSPILIQNCEATGCEAGYNVQDVTIENSRGDAVNGPLLYLSGDDSEVELALMSTVATTTLHAIATIAGNNHEVTINNFEETRPQEHKIILGATRPSGTNPFSPIGTSATSGITLNNCTEMPVEILSNTSFSIINTNGTITDNGSGNTINLIHGCDKVGKTYYIDNPKWDLRLAADGGEDAYTISTSTTGSNVEWVVKASATTGYYYLDCNGGGSNPRIRTDKTENPDMTGTSSTGSWTKWAFTPSVNETYLLTTLEPTVPRLRITDTGVVEMVTADSSGGWTRFTFTEVPNSSSSKLQNTKSSVKYENEIFGSENSIAIYPNPVSNILTINVSSSNFNQYTIFDISGRVSLKGKFVKGTVVQDINVSDLSKGIYIISLSSDETNKVFKWVKN